MLSAYNMMKAATGNGHFLALLLCLLFAGVAWSPANFGKLTVNATGRV
jgi:hypothetical protein